jgi:hypothetical protein
MLSSGGGGGMVMFMLVVVVVVSGLLPRSGLCLSWGIVRRHRHVPIWKSP